MKKLISLSLVSLMMFSSVAYGQEKKSDAQYLPEKGDFAVGVDLVPLLRTIGGAFNNAHDEVPVGGTAFSYDELYLKPNVSLQGKYMFTDKWALKVNLGLALTNNNHKGYVADDRMVFLDPTSEAKVVDTEKVTRFGGTLMAGAEYRLGKRRVQGIFGCGILLGASSYKASYSYGNTITELNQTPSQYFNPDAGVTLPAGYRVTSLNSNGPNVTAGVYGSAGFEWFVAPKIALGAEVDLYFFGCFASQANVKSQGFSEAYHRVDNRVDLYKPGNSSFNFGTDNIGGQLYMSFYF